MTRIVSDVALPTSSRHAGRWLLVSVAIVILCSCRGVDSPMVEVPLATIPQPVTNGLDTSESAIVALPDMRRPQTTHSQSATGSLSDQDTLKADLATRPESVMPVGHTTPVVPAVLPPAGSTFGQPPRMGAAQSLVEVTSEPSPLPYSTGTVAARWPMTRQNCPPAYSPLGNAQPAYPSSCYPQPTACQSCQRDPSCPCGVPCGPWTPPGLPCPWPDDEYLCDGGDKLPAVRVRQDWKLDGLELEDTVVHYDTIEGETFVEPSNRVCLYAPRFASVRKVYGILQHDYLDRIAGVEQPVPLEGLGDVQIATTNVQPLQPGLNLGTAAASGIRERTPPIGLDNRQGLVGTHGSLIPYEDITDLHRAMVDNSEKARLADLIQAAVVWSHDAAVQVVIDNIATHEDVSLAATQAVHIYSLEGKPRLQVCKMASRTEARPGETVEFTLHFENVGDQVIGNVTVVDNLTTRLEYVEESQSCSLKANFSASENQGESLMLRWEITEPLKVTEGGVIRFTCRVR